MAWEFIFSKKDLANQDSTQAFSPIFPIPSFTGICALGNNYACAIRKLALWTSEIDTK